MLFACDNVLPIADSRAKTFKDLGRARILRVGEVAAGSGEHERSQFLKRGELSGARRRKQWLALVSSNDLPTSIRKKRLNVLNLAVDPLDALLLLAEPMKQGHHKQVLPSLLCTQLVEVRLAAIVEVC